MVEEEKKTGGKPAARGIHARIFLLTMLFLFAGTVGLLIYTYFKHGAPAP